jgi:hypothetical protein
VKLELEEADVQEEFFARGWTDGLPIVPPTPERVEAMLGAYDPGAVLGAVPARGLSVTTEETAINAVLAGCRPEYFPLVVAALEAVLDPAFNANAVLTSTGGAAVCVLVSGPLAAEIGMAARHNALGGGNRANATIGRAVRLVARNILGARTGGLDGSSLGHPGKITLCFAEDPPPAPWEPLRVTLGFSLADTTVTVVPTEGPRQIGNGLSADPEGVLRTFVACMRNPSTYAVGKGGQAVVVLGPEHAAAVRSGFTQQAAREFLARESRISREELEAAGVPIEDGAQYDMTPGDDGLLPTVAGPDDIFLVTAGGEGAGWSAYLPTWAPTLHARSVTRRVRFAGEALPDCGPDGCAVPWAS